jgi:predicted transcriptional regulator
MDQAREKEPEFAEENVPFDQIVEKVKVIVQGSHGALFGKVVDSFFELSEPEYFSQEDLADIEEGMADIREGRCLTLEEYRSGKRL